MKKSILNVNLLFGISAGPTLAKCARPGSSSTGYGTTSVELVDSPSLLPKASSIRSNASIRSSSEPKNTGSLRLSRDDPKDDGTSMRATRSDDVTTPPELSEIFRDNEGCLWICESIGKTGGQRPSGPLSGHYKKIVDRESLSSLSSSGGASSSSGNQCCQKAFIKRDCISGKPTHAYRGFPEIAEVMSSVFMQQFFPNFTDHSDNYVGVKTSLVVTADKKATKDCINDEVRNDYELPYLCSFKNGKFIGVLDTLAEIPGVKRYMVPTVGTGRNWRTPAVRMENYLTEFAKNRDDFDDTNLENSETLRSLQRAFIGNFLLSNYDVHPGNMIGYKKSADGKLLFQTFDFGNAFNFERKLASWLPVPQREAKNRTVDVDSESHVWTTLDDFEDNGFNHLVQYPKTWTTDSASFWEIVLNEVPNAPFYEGVRSEEEKKFDIYQNLLDPETGYLSKYYSLATLKYFFTFRLALDDPGKENVEEDLKTLSLQLAQRMNLRIQDFKRQAQEELKRLRGI